MERKGSVRFSIKTEAVNPEGELNFTAIGVGTNKREAAVFAFGMVCATLNSEDEEPQEITSIEEAMKAISEMSIDVEGDINKLINDQMESDYFSVHDRSSEMIFSLEDLAEGSPIGGSLENLTWLEREY